MAYMLITPTGWRMMANRASNGSFIRYILPDDSFVTPEGINAEIEGGINNCKEASFTASGDLGLDPLTCITIQVANGNTWYNIFKGELVMQPNKWDTNAGYYNIVGYRKRMYEILLPDKKYTDTEDVGKLVRHVMYDISPVSAPEFNAQAKYDSSILGPNINVNMAKIPNIGRTAPEVTTNSELVGALFEKIETFFEDNATPTKFGVDPSGDFVFAPVNNDVFDMANHPTLEYTLEWPAIQNERVITAVRWYLSKDEETGKIYTWDYVDTNLASLYNLRYKRLILKNDKPFRVVNSVYSSNNTTLNGHLQTEIVRTQLRTNSKQNGDIVVGYSVGGPVASTTLFGLEPDPSSGWTGGGTESSTIRTATLEVTSNVDARVVVNGQFLGNVAANVLTPFSNLREGTYPVRVEPLDAATYPAVGQISITLRGGFEYGITATFTAGSGTANTVYYNPSLGTGEYIEMTIQEDYAKVRIAYSFTVGPSRVVHTDAVGNIKAQFVYYPNSTGGPKVIEQWLGAGVAGDKVRIYDKESPSEDANANTLKARIALADMYAEGPNTDLLIPYSKVHIEGPESEPAQITINAILLDPPGKFQMLRPDGSVYLRRIESVSYPLSSEAFGTTIIKLGKADDPMRKAQALAIEMRDENAKIEAYTGNESLKSGL